MHQLNKAWQESDQAARFLLARSADGVILYKNIEAIFSQETPRMQAVLQETLHRLTNPETRSTVLSYVCDSFCAISQRDCTLTQLQTVCIRFLIELNGHLCSPDLPETELRTELNRTLSRILLCQYCQNTLNCLTDYMEWLVLQLEHCDDQRLGTGVIRDIQLYIRQHYAENISLNFLADHFYLHSNYLSRLFKEKTGKNFIDYLTEIRMEKAQELLRNTEYKIIEICAMTGYDNPRYFSKLFKSCTGMTPREYREKKCL